MKLHVIEDVFQFDSYVYVIMLHLSLIVVMVYSVTIWCSYRVYRFIKVQKSVLTMHHGFLDVQEQLTKTLIAQAVIPLFTVTIPIIVIIITVVFPVTVDPTISAFTGIAFAYIPLGNALSMLFFVKPYQRQGLRILKFTFRKIFKKNENMISSGIGRSSTT